VSCRLLYLIGQLRLGGAERQLCSLLAGMPRHRYQPAVVVWNSREDAYGAQLHAFGVPLHAFPPTLSGHAKLRAFRRIVRQMKPEVVHSYTFYTNFAAWWATLGTQTIAMGSVRGDFFRERKDTGLVLGRLSACWPRSQIFNSVLAAQSAQCSPGPFGPRQLFVVRNGLDLGRFRSVPVASSGRACIVGVGSLFPVKRWDRLLVATAALQQQGLDFLVRIVGDGPLRAPLMQQAQALGLTERVEFVAHSADIPSLLADATLLVHTSDSEGCPNVVMEAMACGRAVVATDAGEVPLLVEDGKTGFVVRRGDEAMLVTRLATLFKDRDLCRRMGDAGRAKAEREFGLERLVSETLAAYRVVGWKDT
jgi:glycosyltransferase involved in cell wall biosynthesis